MRIINQGKVASNINGICNDAALFQGNKESGSLGSIAATNPLFNKSGTRDWSFNKTTAHRTNFDGPRRNHKVKALSFKYITAEGNVEYQSDEVAAWSPCYPTTLQVVSRSKGFGATVVDRPNPTAVFDTIKRNKRVRTEVINKITGDVEEKTFRLTFREVHYGCHGKCFTFKRCNGNRRVRDSRSDTLVSLDFAKSELVRMLGREKGLKAFSALDS